MSTLNTFTSTGSERFKILEPLEPVEVNVFNVLKNVLDNEKMPQIIVFCVDLGIRVWRGGVYDVFYACMLNN